jgi:nucleoside-diphosphate-sugar epimerase
MTAVLILGDYGFIGKNLTLQMLARGWDVANPEPFREFIGIHDEGHGSVDVRDWDMVQRSIAYTKADLVINCAAIKGSAECDRYPKIAYDTNYKAAVMVANICQDSRVPLIHFGTTSYYDSTEQRRWLWEGSRLLPKTMYGWTKFAAEYDMRSIKGLRYLVIRPVFGYGNEGPFAAGIQESWPDVIRREARLGRREPLDVSLGASYIKDFTHITDLVDATERVIGEWQTVGFATDWLNGAVSRNEDPPSILIGAGQNLTFGTIVQAFDPPYPVVFHPELDYKKEQPHSYSLLKGILPGWHAKIDILEYAHEARHP